MMVYVSEYISFLMIKMVDRGFKLYNPEYTNLTFLLEERSKITTNFDRSFYYFTYVLFLFFQKLNASIWEVGEYTCCTRFIQ